MNLKERAIHIQLLRELMELRSQCASQQRYVEELEKQLEPSVISEIRDELSNQNPTQT